MQKKYKFIVQLLFLLHFLIQITFGVDRNVFKTCEQSSFCRRCRNIQPVDGSPYELISETLIINADGITADIINNENEHLFIFKLEALQHNTFHILIDEKTPLKSRYRVVDALRDIPKPHVIQVANQSDTEIVLNSDLNTVIINKKPFKIDIYRNNIYSLTINGKGLMKFEHLREKSEPNENDDESWEEYFNGHFDSKPNGPEAIALDFTFPQAHILFGIPEHADSFALKSTIGLEPYRLYNLDVFEYELDNGMALYGSVPVIYGHGPDQTIGIFWQNSAETWIDIYNTTDSPAPASYFMSESGIIDTYIMMGPKPNDVFKQYTDLTGVAPLPQMFALGYHQSRWNYVDEQDVDTVSNTFDEYDIPMDTMWLDIEYTDSKKYFTWDQQTFPNPLDMIRNLTAKGRHLVVIIDPHIKRDDNYFFHIDCTNRGYYTKNRDSIDYEGSCWPGLSSYPDLFNPEVREYFADQYLLENFHGTTENVMIWNDMNEPSVFDGPEITMLKDNIHFGGWEHRHVHNLYAHMHLLSTFDGIGRRSNWQQRPFILSRGHFAGSQRLAAIWTGDNTATWEYMAATIKMCLSESVAGFSFCGSDVGGFFMNPDAELLERWYQTAIFQPFVRSHSHIDSIRREPWLFGNSTMDIIRTALRKRYSYLPLWYTLFYEHERWGLPIMRPLLAEYPLDIQSYAIDNQYLLSDKLLIHPVTHSAATSVDVYFPRKTATESNATTDVVGDLWYDIDDYTKIDEIGYVNIAVDSNKIPVYQRGGTIIPKKEQPRQTATLMHQDPYTLIVCLDNNMYAYGTLYIDDGKSYDYRQGQYTYLAYEFSDNVLTSKYMDDAQYFNVFRVAKIVLVGLVDSELISAFTLNIGAEDSIILSTELEFERNDNNIIIWYPAISSLYEWNIKITYISSHATSFTGFSVFAMALIQLIIYVIMAT